jgi:hypothetical protein
MKSFLIFLGTILLASGAWAHGMFGVGPAVGDPLGVTGNFELDLNQSIDAFVGWSGGTHDGTQIHSDYLQILGPIGAIEDQQLFFYWGAGGRVIFITHGKDKNKMAFGPRISAGLETEFADYAWQVFAEAALVLDITPTTNLDADLLIGGRYYF